MLLIGIAILDLMQLAGEPCPTVKCRILCRHPFDSSKRVFVCPSAVKCLYTEYADFDTVRSCKVLGLITLDWIAYWWYN